MIRIETIEDVWPLIPADAGITVTHHADYSVIDYVHGRFETFNTQMILECRGLKFARDGRILARPFHKFFAVDGDAAVQRVDWTRPHRVQERLDGILVHPCRLGGRLVFMTRAGEGPLSDDVRAAADASVIGLCEDALAAGITPLFEFTAPGLGRIVRHDRPRLTLLAARETMSGRYHTHAEILALAVSHGVVLVADRGQAEAPASLVHEASSLQGAAGYVIAFDDGIRFSLLAHQFTLAAKARADQSVGTVTPFPDRETDDGVTC